MPGTPDHLKHVVVVMMSDRSFDHMLGSLKAEDPRIDGLVGNESNPDTSGALVAVQALAEYQGQLNPDREPEIGANGETVFVRRSEILGTVADLPTKRDAEMVEHEAFLVLRLIGEAMKPCAGTVIPSDPPIKPRTHGLCLARMGYFEILTPNRPCDLDAGRG